MAIRRSNIFGLLLFDIILLLFFGLLFVLGTFFDESIAIHLFSPDFTFVKYVTSCGVFPFFSFAVLFIGALCERIIQSQLNKIIKVVLAFLCYLTATAVGFIGAGSFVDFSLLIEVDPEKSAVLWHCTDGKDRTGIAAALLLAALGADMKTILDDYMLTNVYNANKIDAIKSKYSDCTQEKQDVMIFTGGGVIDSYLINAFSSINKQFGSVEGYLTDGLGLKYSDLIQLREKFTV